DKLFSSYSKNCDQAHSKAMNTSLPGSKPTALIASKIVSTASSVPSNLGAKPPSSPTAVSKPRFLRIDFKLWKISAPQRNDSLNVYAPTGMIMNSWYAIGASDLEPPFTMFIIETGNCLPLKPPKYL